MQFLLTIHQDEKASAKATDTERAAIFASYGAYTQELKASGVMKGGEALHPSSQSSRVAVREGKRNVVDGPFSEAKEVLGGFYLIDCQNREEAVKWAAKCPGAIHGTVGVHAIRAM